MSQKNTKLLRKGAKKYKLPLNAIKKSFNGLSTKEKSDFLKVAKMDIYE